MHQRRVEGVGGIGLLRGGDRPDQGAIRLAGQTPVVGQLGRWRRAGQGGFALERHRQPGVHGLALPGQQRIRGGLCQQDVAEPVGDTVRVHDQDLRSDGGPEPVGHRLGVEAEGSAEQEVVHPPPRRSAEPDEVLGLLGKRQERGLEEVAEAVGHLDGRARGLTRELPDEQRVPLRALQHRPDHHA